MMTRVIFLAPVLLGLIIALGACSSSGSATTYSDAVSLGNGTVRTYITTNQAGGQSGTPIAVGVELTASSFEGLPDEHVEIVIPFPQEASVTPFQWMLLDWNPQGHIPPGVYDLPHYDFHFYIMDQAKRQEIKPGACETGGEGVDCATLERATKPVPAVYVAPDHINVGAVVPGMGNHLIDVTGPEFGGTKFDRTFIYGAFDGEITFYEPMVTREYLLGKPNNVCMAFKQPNSFARAGSFPTTYCVNYNTANDSYTVSLEGFATQVASAPQ